MELKTILKQNGIKQRFIADKIGISEQLFSMCLKGDRTLKDWQLEIINNYIKQLNKID